MVSSSWDFGGLTVFEAVGRLENLTLAAEELGMTQPAVSYQIKRIEDRLGLALFVRRPRGVEMLPQGKIFYDAVKSGLAGIEDALRVIDRNRQAPALRITTDYGFATFWLMPRVAAFRQKHPSIDVRITASSMLHPIDKRDADVSIQFGAKADFAGDAIRFFEEAVIPICSPDFLQRHGPFPGGKGLGTSSLLHLDTLQGHRWFTWQSWLAAIGEDLDTSHHGLVLNTYNLVLEAAIAHQGIALGWMGLVDVMLEKGTLVPACDVTLTSDKGYWLVFSPDVAPEIRLRAEELMQSNNSLPPRE